MSLGLGKEKSTTDLGKHGMTATLEPGAEIEGKLKVSSGMVRINSHFKGEISGEGGLLIAEQGEVEAEITLKSVTVMGKVKGSVHVTDRIEIKERGVILGDIYTPVLLVEPGGYFDGQCHMPIQASDVSKLTRGLDAVEKEPSTAHGPELP
ncbi:MAG: bactofilin family protein [Terriglobia bacterium]